MVAVKFKLSENQLREMRTLYTIMTAIKYHKVELENLPNLNPEWLRIMDVLKNMPNQEYPVSHNQDGEAYVELGHLRARRTQGDNWVIEGNFQWRVKGKVLKEAENAE